MASEHDSEALQRVEEFLATVHGMSEMNVVRGIRKAIAGEPTTFQHEVKLSVYGPACGHQPPKHFPAGYGQCNSCRYGDDFEGDNEDDRW